MRGMLSWAGPYFGSNYNVYIHACESGCWGPTDGVYLLASLEPLENQLVIDAIQHKIVDVVGLPWEPTGMADPGLGFVYSEVRETEGGACGPVPNQETTWGSLKALYR